MSIDLEFSEADFSDADVLFLPGGMPGTRNLAAHEGLCGELLKADKAGKRLAAICAGPSVLGGLGILEGRKATCYPGFEGELKGAEYTRQGVVTDGNVTTARGLGYALDRSLVAMLLVFTMSISLAACGGNKSSESTSGESKANESTVGDTKAAEENTAAPVENSGEPVSGGTVNIPITDDRSHSRSAERLSGCGAGNPEIRNLHLSVPRDNDILRLDIPVNDSLLMGGCDH